MTCSICGGQTFGGLVKPNHNKGTCPENPKNIEKYKNYKPSETKTKTKTTISNIKQPSREEAQQKLNNFEYSRNQQYEFSNECVQGLIENKNISIKAEEKTGKRTILECIHLMIIVNHYSDVPDLRFSPPKSVYVTALNRKDTEVQREEQEDEFGILSVCRYHKELLGDIINILEDPLNDGHIYIHIDECDYGTGIKQSLSNLYKAPALESYNHRISYITYSATPEELTCSGIDSDEWLQLEFIPSENYFGASKYLENGLVNNPEQFYDENDFTKHAQKIILDIHKQCELTEIKKKQRNIIVVRDTKPGNLKKIEIIKDDLQEKYKCEIYIYDQSNPFKWGDPDAWKNMGKKEEEDEDGNYTGKQIFKPVIFFIAQICTRSTEIHQLGHRRLYAWHDNRFLKNKIAYNTLSQAIGRVKHYTQPGNPENTIKLYCDENILKFTLDLDIEPTNLGQRISKSKPIKKSGIEFKGFRDKYKNATDVPESEWLQIEDIELIKFEDKYKLKGDKVDMIKDTKFKIIDDKLTHYDKKIRYFNDKPPGAAEHTQDKNVLQYENRFSKRFIIRAGIYDKINIKAKDYKEQKYYTKPTSMWTK